MDAKYKGFTVPVYLFYAVKEKVHSKRRALGNDKVSMLTHTHLHKPLRKIKVTICNRQADNPLYVWPDV